VGFHANADVDVSRPPAELAGMALAADADLLAVVDPRRDLHLELALLERAPGALALGARRRDDLAGAGALRARGRANELTEHAPGDLLDAAGAAAVRTGDRRRSRLGAAPGATTARDGDSERDVARHATRGVDELDLDLRSDVGAARPSRRAAAEQVVAEE